MKSAMALFRNLLLLPVGVWLAGSNLQAAVAFTVTPSTVSNTYNGAITLNITGLSAGQTVTVQKYIDANTNGTIGAGDWLVQQFPLADGQAAVIGGVTNFNVPGDIDSTAGTITARLSLQSGGLSQRFVGSYAFVLSSPTAQFAPLTNLFRITNSAYAQSFTGNIRCSGTNVPNSLLLLFPGSMADSSPTAGVVANNSGAYSLRTAPGTFGLLPFKPGFVSDASTAPTLTLNPGVTLTTNLTLLPANRTISGRFVDAANPDTGLPGILVVCESTDFRLAVGFTDTNGGYSVPVTAGLWRVSLDSASLTTTGYLDVQDHPGVDTTTGSVANVTIPFPKGTALIYGSVKDDQNRGIAGVDLWAGDFNNQYEGSGVTDQSGNYVAAVTEGTWYISPESGSPALANYVISQGAQLTVASGQAVQQNFRAIPTTGTIGGYVLDNASAPVGGVGAYAWANIGGTYYQQRASTDFTGYYSLSVANGSWHVGLNCSGDEDSLNTLGFQCVPEQSITIANNNGVINFIVQPCPPLQVTTSSPLPNGQVDSYFYANLEAAGCFQPFNWSLAPGSLPLPDGLTLWSSGMLEGTPTASGPFSFTVRVTDNNGTWADKTLSLTISASSTPLQVTTFSLADGNRGVFYSQQLTAAGGERPYSWSLMPGSANPPPGLAIGLDGVISGTPTSSGTWPFYVRVTDASLTTADRLLSITINNPPLQITNSALPDATVGGPYNAQLGASGGRPPYSWALAWGSANLPDGLSLSQSGLISGTPTSSSQFSFIVSVTDADFASVNRPLAITVHPRPTLGSPTKPSPTQFQFQVNGAAGQSYTVQASTNLTSWLNVWTTNAPSDSFTVLLGGATGSRTFYRIRVGP